MEELATMDLSKDRTLKRERSEKGEYHSEECAFMSPAMSEFLVAVSCVRSEVM